MKEIWHCFLKNGIKFYYFSYKFNEIIPLDKWKTTVLTKIKSRIPDNEQAGQSESGIPQQHGGSNHED